MARPSDTLAPTSFFLPGSVGDLFAVYYPPWGFVPNRGKVLYVHPFAGEMNHSRHFISEVSRELSKSGLAVLTIDLYGCGDSAGDFGNARWEIWKDDLAAAVRWLREHDQERLTLWGLRLGALLAMDFANEIRDACEKIVLWQPVLRGDQTMTQFLHMNLLPEDGTEWIRKGITKPELRRALPLSERIQVAGYHLSPELISAIDRLQLGPLGGSVPVPIQWMEVVSEAGQSIPPASLRLLEEWKNHGVRVFAHKVVGRPFWLFPYSMDHLDLSDDLHRMFGRSDP